MNDLLKQMAEERTVNNGIIHALRTETLSLSKLLEKQRKENVTLMERKEVLTHENAEKKKIIQEKVCYIAEQARIAKNIKIEVENRTTEFKEEKKTLLRHIIQQNEVANELSKVILSMRAVVRTSSSYVLPYLYTPGNISEKQNSEGKDSEGTRHENGSKSVVSHDVSVKSQFRVSEVGAVIVEDEGEGTMKISRKGTAGSGTNDNGTEETKLDCEEEKEYEDEEEDRAEESKAEKEGEVEVERAERVSESTRKSHHNTSHHITSSHMI